MKKFLPKKNEILEHKYVLKLLNGKKIHRNFFSFNNVAIVRALFIGMFIAMIPMPFQMFVAICFGIYFKANLPISVGLVWITNPFTMPIIFYFEYYIGAWILQNKIINYENFNIDMIYNNIDTIAISLYLGALIFSITSAFISIYTYIFYLKLKKHIN